MKKDRNDQLGLDMNIADNTISKCGHFYWLHIHNLYVSLPKGTFYMHIYHS